MWTRGLSRSEPNLFPDLLLNRVLSNGFLQQNTGKYINLYLKKIPISTLLQLHLGLRKQAFDEATQAASDREYSHDGSPKELEYEDALS